LSTPSMNFRVGKGATAQQVANPPKQSGLGTRALSALVLAPPVLATIYFGSPYFEILIAVAAGLMALEWSRVCASAANRSLWMGAGALYILAPCLSLVWLRGDPAIGRETVFWMFVLVWAADIGAYAFGRMIGGPRLAPAISPKKTWAGFIGGISCAGVTGAVTAIMLGKGSIIPLAVVSLALGAVSQGGDLLESWIKRHFKVKDAGNIIPGHGGVLDRVDGLLAVAAATALIGSSGKGNILSWL